MAMHRENLFRDERILGDGDFVDRVLSEAQERMERAECLVRGAPGRGH
jgi:hypothetical protein